MALGSVADSGSLRMDDIRWTRCLGCWIVLVLCLLSFARGIYQLGEQSLWWDESLSLHRAVRPFSFILSNRMLFLYGEKEMPVTPDQHPPLYFVLLRLVILVAGKNEFALRYLSLMACVLIVPLVYQCGRRLYDPASGICAALLTACSPLYLWAQQEARPYALATLFCVTAFYALLRALDDQPSGLADRSRSPRRKAWAVLCILSTAAMLVTHYHALQLLPAFGVIYVLAQGHHKVRAARTQSWWVLLAAGAVAGGVTLYALRHTALQAEVPGYAFIPLGTLLEDLLRSFSLGISGTRLVLYQWVAFGLLLTALGMLFARSQGASRRHAAYLLVCLTLPVGEIYAISYVRPVYMNIRHVMFASPFYYLLLAAGATRACHIRASRWANTAHRVPSEWAASTICVGVIAAVGMLLVGMGLSTYTYFTDPRYDKDDYRGWGRYLSEHVRPGDAVFVYPGAAYELYTYYGSPAVPYYGIPVSDASPEEAVHQVVEISQRYDRVWVAHSLTPPWAGADDITLEWLKENAVLVASAKFRGPVGAFSVYAFSLDPPITSSLPEEASPLALDFGGQLRLLGLRSMPAEAGHPLRLSLYWSAARPLDRDYRFIISLKDERGRSWSSLDFVPFRGTYPLACWPVDGIVRHDIDIDIPVGTPPGRYWVNVSVYPADRSGPSLAVRDLDSGRLMGLVVPVAEAAVSRPNHPPLDAEVSIARRAKRRYGDLMLLGYDYRGGTYQPGDLIDLDLYWRASRVPRQNLALSLQIADADGTIWATRAIAPAEGYPTSHWQEGEFVQGKHRFRVPLDVPEGEYVLWLGPGDGTSASSTWPWRSRRARLGTLAIRAAGDDRAFEIPPMQHELRAILDDRVELLGYDLENSAVRPGQVVSCTLYWRGLQEMDQDYTVFTHLVAPDGTTWGQWDNQPRQGQSPTRRWVPGQVVADPYQIPLSEAAQTGSLVLRVGMYDLLTMTRLPVLDSSGKIVGDSIAVAELEVVDSTE